uniref:Phospholipase-like protein n=1 Tax=Tanacetum cinerariifolium TaxID=118510 RepID=A0A6L2LTI0_TANCI|nr:phospholipase-like protein [Tanacetum cinerariifolium]
MSDGMNEQKVHDRVHETYDSDLAVECLDDDTEIVPLTYHLAGFIPLRRRVFDSARDGHPITAKMLEDKIKNKQFFTIKDKDAISLCLLAILELVLLGQEPRHNVPEWCLRLVNDRDGWDLYPWGSYVWLTLYRSLKDANVRRWLVSYTTPVEEDGDKHKYMLHSFTRAFKRFPQGGPTMFPMPTPRPQQGFVSWSAPYHVIVDPRGEYGSSHIRDVGGVIQILLSHQKKRSDKSKNMVRNAKVLAFDLGNAVVDDNLVDDEVVITGARDTDECIWYTNVDPNKSYGSVLVNMSGYYNLDEPEKKGWLSDDQINCWMELVIRSGNMELVIKIYVSNTKFQTGDIIGK